MKITNRLTPICIFVLVVSSAQAQLSSPYTIGFNLGAFVYSGDLSPWRIGSLKTPTFVFGLTGHKNLSPTLAARLDLNFGSVRGDESLYYTPEYHRYRAFSFKTTVTELALGAEWSPFGRLGNLSPYAFGSVGIAGLRVRRDYSRFGYEYFINEPDLYSRLQEDIAERMPRVAAIFPVGFGLKLRVNDKISFHGEASHRFTTTDYLDGFSKAGNPKLRDSYTKYAIGLRFSLGAKDPYACPPMRY